jgi:Tol biopolymer transport system component
VVYTYINKLYAVNMATGQTRKLLDLNLDRSYAGAAVGPAGEFAVAYSSRQALSNTSWLTILKTDGSEERTTQFGHTIQGWPMFSPDGSKIAFTAGVYEGWAINTSAQEVSRAGESLLFYGDYATPQWMPDGGLLLFGMGGCIWQKPRLVVGQCSYLTA